MNEWVNFQAIRFLLIIVYISIAYLNTNYIIEQ